MHQQQQPAIQPQGNKLPIEVESVESTGNGLRVVLKSKDPAALRANARQVLMQVATSHGIPRPAIVGFSIKVLPCDENGNVVVAGTPVDHWRVVQVVSGS